MSTTQVVFTITLKPMMFQKKIKEELSEAEVKQIKEQVKNEIRKQYEIPEHLALVISDCRNVDDNYQEDGFID